MIAYSIVDLSVAADINAGVLLMEGRRNA
jgi:hypothetical protein